MKATKTENRKLSPKMIKTLTNLWSDGRMVADMRTTNALLKRGLVTYQVMYTGELPFNYRSGYWPTVDAFELLEELREVSE